MKKVIALILALAMTLTLCACGGSQTSSGGSDGDNQYDTITLTMAVNGTDTQIDTKVANYFKELVEEERARAALSSRSIPTTSWPAATPPRASK